jgi:hypothetical protein
VSDAGDPPPRGLIGLYAAAFVMLVGSGYAQAKGNLESSLRLVWVSIGLSALAALTAVASVLLRPRAGGRRPAGRPSSGVQAEDR